MTSKFERACERWLGDVRTLRPLLALMTLAAASLGDEGAVALQSRFARRTWLRDADTGLWRRRERVARNAPQQG